MRRVLSLVLVLFLAAACAQKTVVDPLPGGQGSYQPDDVVLRVEQTGGFVSVESLVTRVPDLTVYGDGRVIAPGPVMAIYPGPALPNIQVQKVTAQAVRTLVGLAVAAKVGAALDFGQPSVSDGTSTRITVLTSSGKQVSTVYMLGMDNGLTPGQRAARAPLRDLVAKLGDLPGTLGADEVGPSNPYTPHALAAVDSPWVGDPAAGGLTEPERAWPGPGLPGDKIGPSGGNLSCVTVSGSQLATVLDTAGQANQLTPWTWDGERYRMRFRPLLPDESSCADLREH
jgi:hypothetical protein